MPSETRRSWNRLIPRMEFMQPYRMRPIYTTPDCLTMTHFHVPDRKLGGHLADEIYSGGVLIEKKIDFDKHILWLLFPGILFMRSCYCFGKRFAAFLPTRQCISPMGPGSILRLSLGPRAKKRRRNSRYHSRLFAYGTGHEVNCCQEKKRTPMWAQWQ